MEEETNEEYDERSTISYAIVTTYREADVEERKAIRAWAAEMPAVFDAIDQATAEPMKSYTWLVHPGEYDPGDTLGDEKARARWVECASAYVAMYSPDDIDICVRVARTQDIPGLYAGRYPDTYPISSLTTGGDDGVHDLVCEAFEYAWDVLVEEDDDD